MYMLYDYIVAGKLLEWPGKWGISSLSSSKNEESHLPVA
jgi:hypothetical protein